MVTKKCFTGAVSIGAFLSILLTYIEIDSGVQNASKRKQQFPTYLKIAWWSLVKH